MQVWQHILAQGEPLIEIFLIEVAWLPSEGVQYQPVFLLRDFDTWDPGTRAVRKLDSLLGIAAVVQPEFYLRLI